MTSKNEINQMTTAGSQGFSKPKNNQIFQQITRKTAFYDLQKKNFIMKIITYSKFFKNAFFALMLFVTTSSLYSQECILWFEGPGASSLGHVTDGCAPCGVPVVYYLKNVNTCSANCVNLLTQNALNQISIDNAKSYKVLGARTIEIVWNCNDDQAGVIYTTCVGDNATAVRICRGSGGNTGDGTGGGTGGNTGGDPGGDGGSGGDRNSDEDDSFQNKGASFISPNPANGYFSIRLSESHKSKAYNVQLIDLSGTVIRSTTIPEGSKSLDLEVQDIPAGIYVVKINGEIDVFSQKVVLLKQ
jgi:hypothetical protein